MSQYRGAYFYVENGQSLVRQIGELFGVASAPFDNAEVLSWAGGGAGVHVRDTGSTLSLYRTAGPIPAVGDTITGISSSSTFTVQEVPAENLSLTTPRAAYPGKFKWGGGGSSQGPILPNDRFAIVGSQWPIATIGTVTDDGIEDSFSLTAVWGGDTLINYEWVINRDATTNYKYPIAKQGSRAPFTILEEFQHMVDSQFAGLSTSPPGSWTQFTLNASQPWVNVSDATEPRPALSWSWEPATQTVRLKGYIEAPTSATQNAEIVLAINGLPEGYRPGERLDFNQAGIRFSIDEDGAIRYRGPTLIPGPVSFNGIAFRAEQ